jgi:cytoskeletal protein CcmA (bactofilin family)
MGAIALCRIMGLLAVMMATAALLIPSPTAAQERTEDIYVRVNGAVNLAAGEGVDILVTVNGDTRVDGSVRDTLVVVNETATVSGDIGQEAIVFNGVIRLEPTARIGGDLTLVNSELVAADGAVIAGSIAEHDGASVTAELSRAAEVLSFVAWLGLTLLFVVLALAWAAIGGRQLSHMAGLLGARPELAVVGALIFWIVTPLVAVAALATVIGIPLGIALLIVVLPLLWSLGYVTTGTRLGFFLDDLRGATPNVAHPYLEAVLGVAIFQLIGLVPVVGWLVVVVAGLLGAGAIVVHAWRRFAASRGPDSQPLLDAES